MHKLKNLRAIREQLGLLQKDVAAIVNVNRTTYVKYENGDSEPPLDILRKLAKYFYVSIDYLLGLTDDPCFSGGPLAAFIRNRRGDKSEEEFAKECGISVELLRRIETGFRKTDEGNMINQQSSLSTEDMENIAKGLSIDWRYIACLYAGFNPNKASGFTVPHDDRTGELSHQILHDARYQKPLTTEEVLLITAYKKVNDDDIKYALFGDNGEITDAMYDEVKDFAAFVKKRHQPKAYQQEGQAENIGYAARKSDEPHPTMGPDTDPKI